MADDSDNARIKDVVMWIYIGAIPTMLLVWIIFIGWSKIWSNPAMIVGFVFAMALLITNAIVGRSETLGTPEKELSESGDIHRNGFQIVSGFFALGALVFNSRLYPSIMRDSIRLLMLAIFFGTILVMMPFWIATDQPEPIVVLKHVKSSFMIYGAGFMVAVLALFFRADSLMPTTTTTTTTTTPTNGIVPSTPV